MTLEIGCYVPSLQIALVHLVIHVDEDIKEKVGLFIAGFKDTLETLHLDWYDETVTPIILPQGITLSKLSHLHLAPPECLDIDHFTTFFQSTPSLHILRWDDKWNDSEDGSALPLCFPSLPSGLKSVEASIILTLESQDLVSSITPFFTLSTIPYVDVFVRVLCSPDVVRKLVREALIEGVNLTVSTNDHFDNLPALSDIWRTVIHDW